MERTMYKYSREKCIETMVKNVSICCTTKRYILDPNQFHRIKAMLLKEYDGKKAEKYE
jgi:hypothetical protein